MERDPGEEELLDLSRRWMVAATRRRYSHRFTWMGRRVFQLPQDLMALQQLLWEVKPRLVVETGLGLGGGALFYASVLELIGGPGEVAGIDVRVLEEVRADLSGGPLARRIRMIEGSSTSQAVVEEVTRLASAGGPVMVVLDSDHTREHVLRELELYAPLVTPGSFLVVLDTAIAELPPDALRGAPFGPGNDPAAAVSEFLRTTSRFVPERRLDQSLAITSAPGGFLRCVGPPGR